QHFGCGTKLPHSVVGLLGVSNGAEGDLRPGLWRQTTEIHDPIRLVTLVEAEPEAITEVLGRLPGVKDMAVNAWIHLFACSPSGRGFFRWVGQGFEPYEALPHNLFEVETSLEACTHTREQVAPCLVTGIRAEALKAAS
ncbi:MAG: putative inorganic carbon transporter subunit DabA, partial [Myxococcota bacterium]